MNDAALRTSPYQTHPIASSDTNVEKHLVIGRSIPILEQAIALNPDTPKLVRRAAYD
jgi:hypothetical protein